MEWDPEGAVELQADAKSSVCLCPWSPGFLEFRRVLAVAGPTPSLLIFQELKQHETIPFSLKNH